MAYIKLADGSTFQGGDSDVVKAIAAYSSKVGTTSDPLFSNVTISPEVTKIVEKVPVEVEKIVEKAVQVPVLPDRPLTKDEIAFLTNMTNAARHQHNVDTAIGIGVSVAIIGGCFGLLWWLSKK